MKFNFVVFGARHNTKEFIERCLDEKIPIDLIVSVSPDVAKRNSIPSYESFSYINDIPVYSAKSYKLNHQEDVKFLSSINAQFAVCIGWQRIIPTYVLDRFRLGIFGMHCSPKPLPYGKGRSPINWAIIEGAKNLYANVFKYTSTFDDGDILSAPILTIEGHDNIHTVQLKAQLIFYKVIKINFQDLSDGNIKLISQSRNFPTKLYPKREPQDGLIDWRWSMREIADFTRAQTSPYPGAYSWYLNEKIFIYECWPFNIGTDIFGSYERSPGEIVHVGDDNSFLVSCGDGLVHVRKHCSLEPIRKGIILKRVGD